MRFRYEILFSKLMFTYPKEFDVIVVGAGHAGVEAALAAARIGCEVLVLTMNPDTIGQMSCNPAIGGQAKGQMVREIDAIGGEMGKTTDMTGLQFKMLNTKRGPAVWSPRAQCDKKAYQFRLKWICEQQKNLEIKQAQALCVLQRNGKAIGVDTTLGARFLSKAVIITTGTFLQAVMHVGSQKQAGGRAGDQAAVGLSESLKSLGIKLGRFKTGTPPRLNRRSIDFSKMETQHGDCQPPQFSYWREDLFHMEQVSALSNNSHVSSKFIPGSILAQIGGQLPCFLTHTTQKTAQIVRENLHLSPLYSGIITGVGPRYCPSIEDKIVRFENKERHQLFLEPEGILTEEYYINGLSTSLPFEAQTKLIRSIIGCENAEIVRPAYAVEYDFTFPHQLFTSLETKSCEGLFLAGQINGTSGYEEAAAQGLMAGINAARKVQGLKSVSLGRDQAYIGVLIDDLVTKGTNEPYRMFTSRAEHRLLLRQDNADMRLAEFGYLSGLLPERNFKRVVEKRRLIDLEIVRLHQTRRGSDSLAQILRRPEVKYENIADQDSHLPAEVCEQVEIEIKYAGYVSRQIAEVNRVANTEKRLIPKSFDYAKVTNIGIEARQKLSAARPETVGQASRISGVTPADISLLLVWMKRYNSCITSTITMVCDDKL